MSIGLRQRMPAQELLEQLLVARSTGEIRELPFGIVRLSDDAMAWYRGVRGELDVAARLAKLPTEWTVLHSLPVGTRESDIDHLAIGPGGIFAINSKRHRGKRVWVAGGTLMVDGQKQDHIRNSAFEAQRIRKLLAAAGLDVPVTPVIALSGADSLTVKKAASWNGERVEVVEAHALRRLLRRHRTLEPDALIAADAILADPAAWGASPRTGTDPAVLRETWRFIDRGISRWNTAVWLGGVLAAGLLATVSLELLQVL